MKVEYDEGGFKIRCESLGGSHVFARDSLRRYV